MNVSAVSGPSGSSSEPVSARRHTLRSSSLRLSPAVRSFSLSSALPQGR